MVLVEDESILAPTVSVVAVGPFPVSEVTRGLLEVSGPNVVIRSVRFPPYISLADALVGHLYLACYTDFLFFVFCRSNEIFLPFPLQK